MLKMFTQNSVSQKRSFSFKKEGLSILGLLFLIFTNPLASWGDCGCDYVVPSGKYEIDGKKLGLKPGDVVCLKASTAYGNLKFVNIVGTASKPIIIKNCGGQVTISTSSSSALKTLNSKYFRITGSGSSDKYGIVLKNATTLGLTLGQLSTNFEVDRLEIANIGFAGIMAKTDPSCGKPYGRDKFTMRDIKIHDNYIHDTQGEGIYVGNSAYAKGVSTSCGKLLPHAVENAKVYNNRVVRTGWDGIQIGAATKGCEVYGNMVEDFGKKNNGTHGNGIQLGEGTGGKCYNNVIKNGYANGIIVLGKGDNVIFNNVIVGVGGNGSFIDSRMPATTGDGFKFFNNTIINPGDVGVRIYATQSGLKNQVKNNLVVGGDKAVALLHDGVTNTAVSNNYHTKSISNVKFVNADQGDYRLTAASPCVDKGVNLTSYGVTFGLAGSSRPKGNALDQGAYEYNGSGSSSNKSPTVSAGSDKTVSLPTTSVKLKATAADPDGSVASYQWTKKSGPSATMSNAKSSELTVSNLVEGNYIFSVTVKDNKGASSSDEVKVSVTKKDKKDKKPPVPVPSPSPSVSNSSGLKYSYFEGSWDKFPDFRTLTPKATGTVSNFTLSPRKQNDYFGFKFEGDITIATSGTYTFYLASDDGSKMYIDGKKVVDNDGLHARIEKSGSMYLSKGKHAIIVAYFEKTGDNVLDVFYQGPGFSKKRIPDSVLGGSNARTIATNPQKSSFDNLELAPELEISMYPNPASDYLTISNAPDAAYSIISASGKIMSQGTLLSSERLNVSSLPNGLYIVRVQQEDAQLTERVLIQH